MSKVAINRFYVLLKTVKGLNFNQILKKNAT